LGRATIADQPLDDLSTGIGPVKVRDREMDAAFSRLAVAKTWAKLWKASGASVIRSRHARSTVRRILEREYDRASIETLDRDGAGI
jgi:hypothetical protein